MITLIPEEHRALRAERAQQIQCSRSMTSLRPQDAQKVQRDDTKVVHGQRSKASLKPATTLNLLDDGSQQSRDRVLHPALRVQEILDGPKSGSQQLASPTKRTSSARHAPRRSEKNALPEIKEQTRTNAPDSGAAERSKYFVRTQEFPSWFALAKGAALTNAVFFHSGARLYEFVYPAWYKPAFLWPSLWQQRNQSPEYFVQLLDASRYALEPLVILREAFQDAPTGRSWRTTTTDEQAVHIASCYYEKVIYLVQRELQKRQGYCAYKYKKARRIRRKEVIVHQHNFKLMQLATDCAGSKGARGADWLFERLKSYLEFIGKTASDEVVLQAVKSTFNDIQERTVKVMTLARREDQTK